MGGSISADDLFEEVQPIVAKILESGPVLRHEAIDRKPNIGTQYLPGWHWVTNRVVAGRMPTPREECMKVSLGTVFYDLYLPSFQLKFRVSGPESYHRIQCLQWSVVGTGMYCRDHAERYKTGEAKFLWGLRSADKLERNLHRLRISCIHTF